ncbi:hypothetical protein Psta_3826 [Pirellula staleyi DSM 6068]|uniref:Uncharacterized protein n=1 Tax=Pirellula staleyi (strain ATCC 27377 / DSM 6068 / ICPB 4128) TaxID=530564 RepID=D2R0Z6_PIRSD|nr:hypothetical protein Psta_3826 [Pirellula staleyi DSM 6068]
MKTAGNRLRNCRWSLATLFLLTLLGVPLGTMLYAGIAGAIATFVLLTLFIAAQMPLFYGTLWLLRYSKPDPANSDRASRAG